MKLVILPWILVGVFLNAAAQLLLKAGSQRISDLAFTVQNAIPMAMQLAANPFILLGLSAYVISVVIWIAVLSRVDVSIAYPMVSLGYVINAIAAYYLFGENLNAIRVGGIFLVLLGVYCLTRA